MSVRNNKNRRYNGGSSLQQAPHRFVRESELRVHSPRSSRHKCSQFPVRALAFVLVAALVTGLVVFAVKFGPRLLNLPVTVTLNGEEYKAKRNMTVEAFATEHLDLAQYSGNLLAVDGSVLREGDGEKPNITANGHPLTSGQSVESKMKIAVTRGADTTEPIKEHITYQKPTVKRSGIGALGTVVDAGTTGKVVIKEGEESKIKLPAETVEKRSPITIQMVKANKNGTKVVALTYDDGPNPTATEKLLKVLENAGVKATFFMLGSNIKAYPELAKKVALAGHQVAGHSYTHTSFTTLTPKKVQEEMDKTTRAIEDATGAHPTWMRPPYGAVDSAVYKILGKDKTHFAMWSIDTLDWQKPGTATIVQRVVSQVGPGSVVLMHDGGGDRSQSIAASKAIIAQLKAQGFTFVTVQEMYDMATQ